MRSYRFHFSIRFALLGVALWASVLGAIRWDYVARVEAHRRERQALSKLPQPQGLATRRVVPFWLKPFLTQGQISVFDRVTEIDLRTSLLSGPDVQLLSDVTHLRRLTLGDNDLSGASLAFLVRLRNIEELDLRLTQMTDATLQTLPELHNLRVLVLADNRITGAGLSCLERTPNVEEPDVSYNNAIGPEAVHCLAPLRGLKRLFLRGTRVTSEEVKSISQLPKLEILDLCSTRVSDEAIPILIGCRALKAVGLDGSLVTDEGRTRLQTARPAIKIW